jgi:hypothetical protein
MDGQVLNISPVVIWVVALSQLLTFGLTVWGLLASGSRANARRIDEHGKRLDAHELRVGSIEQSLRTGPTSAEMHELELAMQELRGDLKTMSAVLTGNAAIMDRLEAMVGRHENHLHKG